MQICLMPVHVHPDVHPLYQSHMQPGHVQCAYICGQCALVQPLISSWETRVHFCCRWTWRWCFSSWRAGGWRPRWVTTRGLVTSIKLNCNWAKEDAGRGGWGRAVWMQATYAAGKLHGGGAARTRPLHSVESEWQADVMFRDVQQQELKQCVFNLGRYWLCKLSFLHCDRPCTPWELIHPYLNIQNMGAHSHEYRTSVACASSKEACRTTSAFCLMSHAI